MEYTYVLYYIFIIFGHYLIFNNFPYDYGYI
jgi:hypothetical protein